MALLAALMVGARYEALFLVGSACLLFALRREWRFVAGIGLGAALPVCLYGVFAHLHGAAFLPSSVLLKGIDPGGLDPFAVFLSNCVHGAHLFFMFAAAAVAIAPLKRFAPQLADLLAVVGCAGLIHLVAARVGYAFRYESYLVGILIILLAAASTELPRFGAVAKFCFCAFALTAACLLTMRAAAAAKALPAYSSDVYRQEWQTSHFLATYFPTGHIAANDIGAISFFTDIHCTDLVGLANSDVFAAKRAHLYTTDFLMKEAVAEGVQIAIVYDLWFTGHPRSFDEGPLIPRDWIRVAKLHTPPSAILGDNEVSIYAVDPASAAALRNALGHFQDLLPRGDTLSFEH